MKLVICSICNDFRALLARKTVTCSCGNVTAWWVDPQRGIAKIKASYKGDVAMLGMHNVFLKYGFDGHKHSHEEWRAMQAIVSDHLSDDSLFHKDKRNSPFVIFRVGETSDVSWAADGEEPPKDSYGSDKEKSGEVQGKVQGKVQTEGK